MIKVDFEKYSQSLSDVFEVQYLKSTTFINYIPNAPFSSPFASVWIYTYTHRIGDAACDINGFDKTFHSIPVRQSLLSVSVGGLETVLALCGKCKRGFEARL